MHGNVVESEADESSGVAGHEISALLDISVNFVDIEFVHKIPVHIKVAKQRQR